MLKNSLLGNRNGCNGFSLCELIIKLLEENYRDCTVNIWGNHLVSEFVSCLAEVTRVVWTFRMLFAFLKRAEVVWFGAAQKVGFGGNF